MGHFASHCLEKKKDKEASSSKATVADDGSGDDVAMSAHEPRRWGLHGHVEELHGNKVGSLSSSSLGSQASYGSLKTVAGQVEQWLHRSQMRQRHRQI